MSKGVLLFAKNNNTLDYLSQASFCATRVKKYLNVPVAVATDYTDGDFSAFDHVIQLDKNNIENRRRFYDGTLFNKTANFDNLDRANSYDITPFDETIVMDTDYILANDKFKNCFNSNQDLMMYDNAIDLCHWRNLTEFNYISETSIKFYWATCIYFKKTKVNKIFFNLVKHVKENYTHYRSLYQIINPLYRNDFAFSIAIHILNGYNKNNIVSKLPGTMYFVTDRDILQSINDNKFVFMLEKQSHSGEYTLNKTENQNVHIMNKFSLERVINE